MNFSGIVVTYNDSRRLADCLNSLKFCSELIVVDLGSADNSIDIAKSHEARVVQYEWTPIVERVRDSVLHMAKYDWIIVIDPDEVFPIKLASKIYEMIEKNIKLAAIDLPWQFYFLGHPLTSTAWGQADRIKRVVVNRRRVEFYREVHRGIRVKDGFDVMKLPSDGSNFIKHYWIDSYKQLFEKHWRYLKSEGEAQYKEGERFTFRRGIFLTLKTLKKNLFDYKGIRGGWEGVFLSFFYAWYVAMSWLSLLQYQLKIKHQSRIYA